MFNLWIYHRRPACSARTQHGGSSAAQPRDEVGSAPKEWAAARIAVNAAQSGAAENKVLPFRTPIEGAPREGLVRGDRKPRGRSNGRSKS
jgi:hypothetical protein